MAAAAFLLNRDTILHEVRHLVHRRSSRLRLLLHEHSHRGLDLVHDVLPLAKEGLLDGSLEGLLLLLEDSGLRRPRRVDDPRRRMLGLESLGQTLRSLLHVLRDWDLQGHRRLTRRSLQAHGLRPWQPRWWLARHRLCCRCSRHCWDEDLRPG